MHVVSLFEESSTNKHHPPKQSKVKATMSRVLAIAAVIVVGLTTLSILFAIMWDRRQRRIDNTRWCTLFELREKAEESKPIARCVQLSHISSPRAVRGPAFEAQQEKELARFRRLHADRAAIAPLKVPVWNVLFGGRPFSVELSEALQSLTPHQFDMLRQWLLQNLPILNMPAHEVAEGRWVEVGSVRSQGSDLSAIHIAPLFVQHHPHEARRFNYRIRFRDQNGGEAWVLLGDDDAQIDGMRWIRHGEEVQVLDHDWKVFLGLQWRNRSL